MALSNKPRKIIDITAHGVADFRHQLDARVAQFQNDAKLLAEESMPASPDEPFALSPNDAAARLGIDVSTLYRHYGAAMRRGDIRTLRIGRAVRIIWRSLLEYIENQQEQAA